ncbi:MAG: transposase [Chloroflexota bacterium]
MDLDRWIFVDETGSHLGFTPRYARAPKGKRAHGRAPRTTGVNHTVITALGPQGMLPSLILDGGMTGQAFAMWVEHCLVPHLHTGDVVAMDNVRPHYHPRIRELIEACGAELRYLPSYSPDLNPIEEGFSKFKTLLRKAEARTEETLYSAIHAGLHTITASDARGWFRHCGYAA